MPLHYSWLEKGADVNAKTGDRGTTLYRAAEPKRLYSCCLGDGLT
jgi:hypothetical protein